MDVGGAAFFLGVARRAGGGGWTFCFYLGLFVELYGFGFQIACLAARAHLHHSNYVAASGGGSYVHYAGVS